MPFPPPKLLPAASNKDEPIVVVTRQFPLFTQFAKESDDTQRGSDGESPPSGTVAKVLHSCLALTVSKGNRTGTRRGTGISKTKAPTSLSGSFRSIPLHH
jgi:hypothetical protein